MKQTLILLLCYLAACIMPCKADVIKTADTYSFPFKTGDETWKTYQTAKDLKEALLIQPDVINLITTDNLLDLCIDYPYNLDMLSTDNPDDGFKLLCSEFNGYTELLTRNDLSSVLISKCESIPSEIDRIPSMNEDEVDELSLKYSVVYYMLGLEEVVSELNDTQMEFYYDAINENLSKMAQHPEVFGLSYQQCRKLIPSRTNRIPQHSYTTIQTPNGYTVVAGKLIPSTELSSSDKSQAIKDIANLYPGATVLSEATGKYNCHAYAWHHKSVPTNNAYWIPDPKVYWETGCYYEVPINEAEIVTYKDNTGITHSAIRINDNEYVSKWGSYPLVRHTPNNVPAYGEVYKGYKRLNSKLTGNGLIKSSSTFSIGQIPSCYTVAWSLSDDYYSQNCMVVNNDTTCTITRSDTKDLYDATLSVSIKFNGYNVYDFSKKIFAYKNFRGTYDCTGYSNAPLTYPYIINTTQGDNVLIKSPSLKGATVTYEGDITPRYFSAYDNSSEYGIISTGLSSTGRSLVMHVVTTSGERYDLIILTQSRSAAMTSSFENNTLTITYDQVTDMYTEYNECLSNESTDNTQIYVEIRDLLTNAKIFDTVSTNDEIQIYTGDWKPGLYTVTAKARDEVMTKKILIK